MTVWGCELFAPFDNNISWHSTPIDNGAALWTKMPHAIYYTEYWSGVIGDRIDVTKLNGLCYGLTNLLATLLTRWGVWDWG